LVTFHGFGFAALGESTQAKEGAMGIVKGFLKYKLLKKGIGVVKKIVAKKKAA
jgi:hypothetical protein